MKVVCTVRMRDIFLKREYRLNQMVKANDMMSVADVKEILAIPLIGVIPEDECVIVSTNRGGAVRLLTKHGIQSV